MSTALMVLPRVYGMAEVRGNVLGEAVRQMAGLTVCPGGGTEGMDPAVKKGPHRLRLVASSAVSVTAGTAQSRPAVGVPVAVRRADPELAFYRKYTEGLLRRYLKLSMEAGRVPSLLGQEMFRGKVTSYRVRSFEDVVIFVHDVDKCLSRLDAGQRHLIRRIALEEYTQAETAAMLGISLRTVVRRYAEAIDKLTRVLLELRMLEPLEACREG